MKKVSICLIAKTGKELEIPTLLWQSQKYKNFEIINAIGNSVSKNRNVCIEKATGDILLFVDNDLTPYDFDVIEKLASSLGRKEILKATEVLPQYESSACTAIYKNSLKDMRFDESFKYAEDSELIERLKRRNFTFSVHPNAFVFHKTSLACNIGKASGYGEEYHRIWGKNTRVSKIIEEFKLNRAYFDNVVKAYESMLKGR